MAKVRVYLPTFQRHGMLQRALKSLCSQSFKDWVSEVHNDDPDDGFPGELVAGLGDPRVRIVTHTKNLGGANTMNAFYAPAEEEFISILEDDNWWEPTFLEEMLKAAETYPKHSIYWANMRIWQEGLGGTFADTGKTIHPNGGEGIYEEIPWGDARQVMGAVHSNGACLIRSGAQRDYRIPQVPFATIEMFRERCFPHPLVLVRKPLANFSVTLQSERKNDHLVEWGEATAALAASFFQYAPWSRERIKGYFEVGRKNRPPTTGTLLNAAIIEPKLRFLFRIVTGKEILKWAASLCKRPTLIFRLKYSRKLRREWWEFLDKHTKKRFSEIQSSTTNSSES